MHPGWRGWTGGGLRHRRRFRLHDDRDSGRAADGRMHARPRSQRVRRRAVVQHRQQSIGERVQSHRFSRGVQQHPAPLPGQHQQHPAPRQMRRSRARRPLVVPGGVDVLPVGVHNDRLRQSGAQDPVGQGRHRGLRGGGHPAVRAVLSQYGPSAGGNLPMAVHAVARVHRSAETRTEDHRTVDRVSVGDHRLRCRRLDHVCHVGGLGLLGQHLFLRHLALQDRHGRSGARLEQGRFRGKQPDEAHY